MSTAPQASLVLPAQIKTEAADELRARMLGEPDPVSDIDAGAVSFIGFAALQVLLSAAKSARRDGRALKFSNVSDAFRQSLDWMGLSLSDFESEGAASVN